MNWRFKQIKPLIQTEPRSKERRKVFEELVGKSVNDWTGRERTLTKLTLYDWLKRYEEQGIQGLARPVRADKGRSRTIISQK